MKSIRIAPSLFAHVASQQLGVIFVIESYDLSEAHKVVGARNHGEGNMVKMWRSTKKELKALEGRWWCEGRRVYAVPEGSVSCVEEVCAKLGQRRMGAVGAPEQRPSKATSRLTSASVPALVLKPT